MSCWETFDPGTRGDVICHKPCVPDTLGGQAHSHRSDSGAQSRKNASCDATNTAQAVPEECDAEHKVLPWPKKQSASVHWACLIHGGPIMDHAWLLRIQTLEPREVYLWFGVQHPGVSGRS